MNVIHSAASALSLPQDKVKNEQSRLNLYNDSPHFELSLDEFEVYALKRLKVRYVMIDQSTKCSSLLVHYGWITNLG
jgi:hypothetical protein